MSSELLKMAIADAKAVRATALANAKAALEEAFTPKLQSMLSQKLQQEIAGEEDASVTDDVPVADAPVADDAAPGDVPPMADSLGSEPTPEAGFGVEPDGDEAAPEAAPIEAPVEPAADEEIDEYGEGNPDSVEQTHDLNAGLNEESDADYKKKAASPHKTQDPQGPKKELSCGPGKADKSSTGTTDPKEKTSGKVTVKRDVAKFTNDPQGASKEFTAGPGKADKDSTGKVLEEEMEEDVSEETLDEILKELGDEVNQVGQEADATFTEEAECAPEAAPIAPKVAPTDPVAGGDEEINLDELLSEEKEDEKEEKEEEKDEDDKDDKKKNLPPWLQKENKTLKAENEEYRKAVGFLRDRINEVNLLNAKLLYTNRLFKAAALTKEQKIKVIESFDLTKSVREAKLVYATLAESLNFGGKKPVVTPVKKVSASVKTITEGLASKVVASTKPTKQPVVLTEGAEMAARFQKLAGIKMKK